MIGSKAMAGRLERAEVIDARDETTRLLTEFLWLEGCSVDSLISAQRDAKSIDAFIELHIEQGPVLDAAQDIDWHRRKHYGDLSVARRILRRSQPCQYNANAPAKKGPFKGVLHLSKEFENILQVHGGPDSRFTIGRVMEAE